MPSPNEKEQSFNASDVAGSFSFVATSPWTASIVDVSVASKSPNNSPDWITLNKYSGQAGEHTLTITLTPNNTVKNRTATITITTGSAEIVVTVTQKSSNESGEDISGAEYDWVKYETLSIIDDGDDYQLVGDHYLRFFEPGFFRGGRGTDGRMCLIDCGEVSWKDFSVMKIPAWNSQTWVEESIPCVKGHGYFSAVTFWGNLTSKVFVRFWVEDYIMKGGEIVGAKIKNHGQNYDALLYFRNSKHSYEDAYYNIGHTSASDRTSDLTVFYKNSTVKVFDRGACDMYLYDAGAISTYEQFLNAKAPLYNESTWTRDWVPCVKGYAYYVHGVDSFDKSISLSSFYVLDYFVEDGKQVGFIAASPNK